MRTFSVHVNDAANAVGWIVSSSTSFEKRVIENLYGQDSQTRKHAARLRACKEEIRQYLVGHSIERGVRLPLLMEDEAGDVLRIEPTVTV